MNEKTFVYNGTEIRTFERDGEIWMHASDIGKALGFKRGVKSVVHRLGVENVNELTVKDLQGHMQPAYVLNDEKIQLLKQKTDNEEFWLWYLENIAKHIRESKMKLVSADTKMRMLELKTKMFYRMFLQSHYILVTTKEVAEDFNKSERWFTAVLFKLKILVKNKKGNTVVSKKYPNPKYWIDYEEKGKQRIKWTSRGVLMILDKMEELGYNTKYE